MVFFFGSAGTNSNNPTNTGNDGDLYQILGVSSKATQTEIRKAYLTKARQLHPDKQSSSDCETSQRVNDAFSQLSHAYEILFDTKKRAKYDIRRGKSSRTRTTWYGPRSHTTTHEEQGFGGSSRPEFGGTRDSSDFHHQQKASSSSSSSAQKPRSQSNNHYYRPQPPQSSSSSSSYFNERNYQSSANSSTNHHKTRSSSSNHDSNQDHRNNRKSKGGAKSSPRDKTKDENPPNPKEVFGVTLKGDPCKNCIKQGHYCWQHIGQQDRPKQKKKKNPSSSAGTNANSTQPTSSSQKTKKKAHSSQSCDNSDDDHATSNRSSTKHHAKNHSPTLGVKANGTPCLNCIRQGRYCWQHVGQDPLHGKQENNKKAAHAKETHYTKGHKIYGVTQKGQACKRCIGQGMYCYQHKHQETVHASSGFRRQ